MRTRARVGNFDDDIEEFSLFRCLAVLCESELDDVRRPVKENSESASEGKAENGEGRSVLSRLFNCGTKSKKTRVIKVRSGSAAVSSVDGAYCGPD